MCVYVLVCVCVCVSFWLCACVCVSFMCDAVCVCVSSSCLAVCACDTVCLPVRMYVSEHVCQTSKTEIVCVLFCAYHRDGVSDVNICRRVSQLTVM